MEAIEVHKSLNIINLFKTGQLYVTGMGNVPLIEPKLKNLILKTQVFLVKRNVTY